PAFTWEVRANDRSFHRQFRKKSAFCLSKRKYSVSQDGPGLPLPGPSALSHLFIHQNTWSEHSSGAEERGGGTKGVVLVRQDSLTWPMLWSLCLSCVQGRHRSDRNINSRPCEILAGKRRMNGSVTPQGCFIFLSLAPAHRETNLKFRQALLVTHQELGSEESMAAFDGRVLCEEPNSRMHTFTGTLRWRGRSHGLDSERILLRGCRLRNTALCYGLVLYAGFDSKIMRNCGKIKRKKTKLDHLMDRLVVVIFLVLLVTSLGLAVASGFWARTFQEKHGYLAALYKHTSPAQQAFLNFWGFTILLSVIIPMSMYITFEFIYLVNSCFISWDLEMYYGAKDIPAEARSTSLSDQLGQIEFIFSDKTGTLTQNVMSFKKCCVNGTIYGNPGWAGFVGAQMSLQLVLSTPPELAWWWRCCRNSPWHCSCPRGVWLGVSVCDPSSSPADQLVYQAASPDEEALVLAARSLGYVFLARTQDSITIRELGRTRTYEVLAMLDFNSDRKRMSVLVRDPQGTIRLYTKGADTVILERLRRRGPKESLTERALDRFAEETLRTLCVASREVGEAEFRAWSRRHREAAVLLQDRAQELDRLYEEMEQDLQVGWGWAQEELSVPQRAGRGVWLCRTRRPTAGLTSIPSVPSSCPTPPSSHSEILQAYWDSNNNLSSTGDAPCSPHLSQQRPEAPCHKRAIIISGDFLVRILHTGEVLKEKKGWPWRWRCRDGAEAGQDQAGLVEKAFVDLATSCQAVICCRVTPKQKALMVQLVKKHKKAITLAIGDGANDVNMIKTADIGVGISGLEGLQAVQCSDYALAQFSFLQRLLLVHGRWNYLRICKFLRYFFYKTFAGLLAQVWFAFHSGFTAQPLYEGWFIALYNIFYTAYPVLSVGLLEQVWLPQAHPALCHPRQSLHPPPEPFVPGHGTGSSGHLELTLGPGVPVPSHPRAMGQRDPPQLSQRLSEWKRVTTALTRLCALPALLLSPQIVLDTQYWTVLSFLMITASLLLFCLFSFLTQSADAFRIAPAIFRFPDASWNALTDPYVLLVVLLSLVVSTLPSLTVRAFRAILGRATTPQRIHLKAKRDPEPAVELRSHVPRGSFRHRSSYAFSHQEGYAGLITRGTSLRARAT
ncbi:AT8B3 ATPase, partial [Erythrocercus mccallii]|nr:AT8B3 ATPase [Erythrocercus mccallii]